MEDGTLSRALRATDEVVVACTGDGRVVTANETARSVTDTPVEGRRLWTVFADSETIERALSTVVASGETRTLTASPTGADTLYELRLSPFEDAETGDSPDADCRSDGGATENPVVGCVGRPVDREVDLDAHLDRVTDGFFTLDGDWRITYINEPARRILNEAAGVDRGTDEWYGCDFWESLQDAVDTPFYDRYHEAVQTGEPVKFEEYYAPLETWFDVRAYPSEEGLAVFFRDVTDDRERRDALAARVRLLRAVYDVISDRARSFTQKTEALLSVGRDFLGTEYGTLSRIREDEYLFEVVDAADDEVQAGDTVPLSTTSCERVVDSEERLVAGDLESEAPDLAARPSNDELGVSCYLGAPVVVEGEVYGTFCFYGRESQSGGFSDWEVTVVDLLSQWVGYELERERATDRLRMKNDRLEEIVSVLSHDIRNPLNVALARVELLDEQSDHRETALDALSRIEELVEDILALAREGATVGDPEPVDLSMVARDAWSSVRTHDLSLRVVDEYRLLADGSRLRQAFENLYRNTVDHADGATAVRVGTTDDGFYVEDDGPGLGDVDADAVFDPAESTEPDATGFGLAIVRDIAEAHGWSVRAVDAGPGARFEFSGVDVVNPGD